MYKCQRCQRTVGPNIPDHRFNSETMEVTYPERYYEDRDNLIHDRGGSWYETVETVNLGKKRVFPKPPEMLEATQ